MKSYSIAFDPQLLLRFVLDFSRFEYALKRAGFLRAGTENAQPDWDSCAMDMQGRFQGESARLVGAKDYLLSSPPRKQIVLEGGGLGWKSSSRQENESEEAYLLRLVRTVRNNLFHGGKFPYPDGPVPDTVRDRRLLEASLVILEECRRLHEDLNAYFIEAA